MKFFKRNHWIIEMTVMVSIITVIIGVLVFFLGNSESPSDKAFANYDQKADVERMVTEDSVKQFLDPILPTNPGSELKSVTCISSDADGTDYRCIVSIVNNGETLWSATAYVECDDTNCLWEYR